MRSTRFAIWPITRFDCLFNVTLILEDPALYGRLFRLGGFKKMETAIEEDVKRYGGKPHERQVRNDSDRIRRFCNYVTAF